MDLTVTQLNGVPVLKAAGRLDSIAGPAFDRAVRSFAESALSLRCSLAAVDLSEVKLLTSAPLRSLIWLKRRLAPAEIGVCLLSPSAMARSALQVAGLFLDAVVERLPESPGRPAPAAPPKIGIPGVPPTVPVGPEATPTEKSQTGRPGKSVQQVRLVAKPKVVAVPVAAAAPHPLAGSPWHSAKFIEGDECIDLYFGCRADSREPAAVRVFKGRLLTPAVRRAAQAMAEGLMRISHPNLVAYREFHQNGSTPPYWVAEWTEGPTLLDLLKGRHEIALSECVRLLGQLAGGLDFAAAQGLGDVPLQLHRITMCDPSWGRSQTSWKRHIRSSIKDADGLELKMQPLDLTVLSEPAFAVPFTASGPRLAALKQRARSRALTGFIQLMHRLLGGAVTAPTGHVEPQDYRAVPALSGDGNDLLERHLSPERSRSPISCVSLLTDLCAIEAVPMPILLPTIPLPDVQTAGDPADPNPTLPSTVNEPFTQRPRTGSVPSVGAAGQTPAAISGEDTKALETERLALMKERQAIEAEKRKVQELVAAKSHELQTEKAALEKLRQELATQGAFIEQQKHEHAVQLDVKIRHAEQLLRQRQADAENRIAEKERQLADNLAALRTAEGQFRQRRTGPAGKSDASPPDDGQADEDAVPMAKGPPSILGDGWIAIPGHDVWLADRVVSQRLWEETLGGPFLAWLQGRAQRFSGEILEWIRPDFPVLGITYEEAVVFCARTTSTLHARGGFPDNFEVRLPTVEEWLAAAGGLPLPTDGGGCHNQAVDPSITGPRSCQAGGPPNALGFFDLTGNVFEWCVAESAGRAPVMGGSWLKADFRFCKGAKSSRPHLDRDKRIGFRLAASRFTQNRRPFP